MTTPHLAGIATSVRRVYADIDAATAAFAAASGLKCRAGCGHCCRHPAIEATVAELLPAAMDVLATGETFANAVYDRAAADPDGVCVFFTPHPGSADQTLGSCDRYATRPSVCRLFGFAAVRGKDATPVLASCQFHKADHPEILQRANAALAKDPATAPHFADYGTRLAALGAATERLPLNTALMHAIERAYMVSSNTSRG